MLEVQYLKRQEAGYFELPFGSLFCYFSPFLTDVLHPLFIP